MNPLELVTVSIISFSIGAFLLGWLVCCLQRPKFNTLRKRICELTEERDSVLREYEASLDACGNAGCPHWVAAQNAKRENNE